MTRRGQASLEMVFLIPLFAGIIGGGMFMVYSFWQGIKVQQGANLAARIQGQERVSGGLTKQGIEDTNGVGVDMSFSNGDSDPTQTTNPTPTKAAGLSANTVYGRYRKAVQEMFSDSSQVYVPPPLIGQNIDKVKVVRVINVPKIPFFESKNASKQIKLEGTAWGGEDTYMYGLPRWGQTSNVNNTGSDSEWRKLAGDKTSEHD